LATTSSPPTNSFVADACLDIGDIRAVCDAVPWRPDIIFASPPCNAFSTSSIGRMWMRGSPPSPKRSERYPDAHPIAMEGMRLVSAMLRIIAVQQPTYWVIENPRGRLRSLDLLNGIPRRTVWY
jgi:site-specific DNA-cytosine methylase